MTAGCFLGLCIFSTEELWPSFMYCVFCLGVSEFSWHMAVSLEVFCLTVRFFIFFLIALPFTGIAVLFFLSVLSDFKEQPHVR